MVFNQHSNRSNGKEVLRVWLFKVDGTGENKLGEIDEFKSRS